MHLDDVGVSSRKDSLHFEGTGLLVPREPDDAMIEAGEEVLIEGREWGRRIFAADIYAAMIAAAPTRAEPQHSDGGCEP